MLVVKLQRVLIVCHPRGTNCHLAGGPGLGPPVGGPGLGPPVGGPGLEPPVGGPGLGSLVDGPGPVSPVGGPQNAAPGKGNGKSKKGKTSHTNSRPTIDTTNNPRCEDCNGFIKPKSDSDPKVCSRCHWKRVHANDDMQDPGVIKLDRDASWETLTPQQSPYVILDVEDESPDVDEDGDMSLQCCPCVEDPGVVTQVKTCQDTKCADLACSVPPNATPGPVARSGQATDPTAPPGASHILEASEVPEAKGWSKQFVRFKQAEAWSVTHQMTHYPKNPFCRHCRACIAGRRQCRRGPGGLGGLNKLEKYGDCVTLDHLISRGEMSEGIWKEQDAVVMLDRYSDHMAVHPTRDKSAIHAYEVLREWRGSTYLHRVHTDGSNELKQAVARFGSPIQRRPQVDRNGKV